MVNVMYDSATTTAGTRRRLARRAEDFGGGFYGVVALTTFLYLELADFWQLWRAADGPRDFFWSLGLDVILDFGISSLFNALWAGMWPFYWFTHLGLPALLVGGAVWWFYQKLWPEKTSPPPPPPPPPPVAPSTVDLAPASRSVPRQVP